GEDERVGGILLMALLDAALHLVYELPIGAFRPPAPTARLAQLPVPTRADRAALFAPTPRPSLKSTLPAGGRGLLLKCGKCGKCGKPQLSAFTPFPHIPHFPQ